LTDTRRVHARLTGVVEVVRYDRAGKWYVEPVAGRRWRVSMQEAAQHAARHGLVPNYGLPGGATFDGALRRLLDAASAEGPS
jgi:hypothetical protein